MRRTLSVRWVSSVLACASGIATLFVFVTGLTVPDVAHRIIDRIAAMRRRPTHVERSLELDPGRRSRLTLQAARLNGFQIDVKRPELQVTPGMRITGTTSLRIDSAWRNAATVIGMTPNWGDHATSAKELGQFGSPVQQLPWEVAVDVTAPMEEGDYAIIFAFRGEFTAAQVLSATGWHRDRVFWNNGDDVASWSTEQVRRAIEEGRVLAPYDIPEHQVYIPAAAIWIKVKHAT